MDIKIFVLLVTFSIVIWLFMYSISTYLATKNRLKRYEISLSANITDDIPKLLNSLINECFQEHLVFFNAYNTSLNYINTEMENKMIEDVNSLVGSRISEALYDRLCLYYNNDILPDVISKKVFMVVTAYVAQYNIPKKDIKK